MDMKEQFLGHRRRNVDGEALEDLREIFLEFAQKLDKLPDSREKSLCMTRLEESQMWAARCIELRLDDRIDFDK